MDASCIAINHDGYIFTATTGSAQRSTDNGDTWETPCDTLSVSFIHILDVSPEGYIYLGANGGSANPRSNYYTPDNGITWIQLDLELQAIKYVFKEDGSIFAGVVSGTFPNPPQRIYRSTDNGQTWEQVLDVERANKWSMAVNSKGDIFAASFGHSGNPGVFYRSTDNGNTWIQIGNGLPNLDINSIVINSQDIIFAGVDSCGVYCSADNGENWTEEINGLSDIYVTSLGISHDNIVFAGTEKGQIFQCIYETSVKRDSGDIPGLFTIGQYYPNPFNPVTTITYSIKEPSRIKLEVYSVSGHKVSTLVNDTINAGNHTVTFDGAQLASGVYFCRVESDWFTRTGKMLLMK